MYLLPDYAHFLFHVLIGEIGILYEIKQYTQVFLIICRTAEQICCLVKGCVGIAVCACFGKKLEHSAFLILEQLMLQKMCDTFGNSCKFTITVSAEHIIYRAVFRANDRFNAPESLHFADVDIKSALMLHMDTTVACTCAFKDLFLHHSFTSLSSMRYSVSSFSDFAASMMRSFVTLLKSAAISSGVTIFPSQRRSKYHDE